MLHLTNRLREERTLTDEEFRRLLSGCDDDTLDQLCSQAREVARERFGRNIYIRGLIEISSFCKNNCLYCGIRRDNSNAERRRLDAGAILECCRSGYKAGFRTFVLQGGEDPWFTDERLEEIVSSIKKEFNDCAVTLSLGERPRESYERLFKAGASRYLLRHETFDESHYRELHPAEMSREVRIECLRNLKEIGFQTGTGIMVGTPGQSVERLLKDIRFIEELKPQMIGIGPFIPHRDTPLGGCSAGSARQTLLLLAIFRLMHPSALIPSTTALATLVPDGRERGILAGANVVMPNLSPLEQRRAYTLYEGKASTGAESAEGLSLLRERLKAIGYDIVIDKGDYRDDL